MKMDLDQLRARCRLPETGSYAIGLSGGADSMALTRLLLPEIREGKIRAFAVHVNHGLRGAESDEDEAFVRRLCGDLGMECLVYRPDLRGRTDEDSARRARFACFREALKTSGADALLLAHNADDQAETFLMRLLRGAGAGGLQGMAEEQETDGIRILRPMLSLGRNEIREALTAEGVAWREDSSNQSKAYLRNRIRLELLPAMEEIAPGATRRICEASRLLRSDQEALQREAEDLYRRSAAGGLLSTETLERAPEAVAGRVLRMWWRACGPRMKERELGAETTKQLLALLRGDRGKMNLPGGFHAVRSPGWLHLTGAEREPAAPVDVTGKETAFLEYRLTEAPSEGVPGDGRRTQEVPEGFCTGCQIRTRRPGDRIRPFGSAGSRKLQDYLTDRKIPEPFRDRIPLLCRGNEVLLVCGVGAGDVPKWDGEKCNVRLIWQGDMPWMK